MMVARSGEQLPSCEFYRRVLDCLHADGVRFLVGGAYALECFTGVARWTKDIDLFVAPAGCDAVLRALERAGYETELTSPVWLAKARSGDDFVDVIFSSGNGIAEVDEDWFSHAEEGEVLGVRVKLCPPEEMIWSRSWVMERERYDGADVAHLLRACGNRMDWQRLLARFGPHWRVLLAHLVLFGFIYPGERAAVPEPRRPRRNGSAWGRSSLAISIRSTSAAGAIATAASARTAGSAAGRRRRSTARAEPPGGGGGVIDFQRGSPSSRCAMMFACTSEVPPAIAPTRDQRNACCQRPPSRTCREPATSAP